MSQFSDQHLIKRLKEGDKKVFRLLIDQYKHMVYTLALRVVKSEADAEEVAQDTFLKVYQSIGSFKGDAKLSTWLYKIAYHRSLDYVKRNKRKPQTYPLEWNAHLNFPEAENTWDHLEQMDRQEIIKKALAKLPAEDGVILSLFYFESQSLKEISAILNLSLSTVKVRLHRSRKRLASVLETMLDEQTISIYASK